MKFLSKILIVVFISISLNSISADVQNHDDFLDLEGVVRIQRIGSNTMASGTGFFISPHILVTTFHGIDGIQDSKKEVSDHLFMVHPKTGKRIPAHFIQALDGVNDLAILYVSEYESSVFYEFSEDTPEPYSKIRIVDISKGSLIEGELSSQYASEMSFQKTFSLPGSNINSDGFSGTPIFLADSKKVIGVFHSAMELEVSLHVLGLKQVIESFMFTEARMVKELLSKPRLSCVSLTCISDALREGSNSKEGQYAQARHLNRISKTTKEQKRLKHYWLKKSAEQGFPPAMVGLANVYLDDQKNEELFEEWMVKASEKNYGPAQILLSKFLLTEKSNFEEGDIEEGIKWAHKAKEHGYSLSVLILLHFVTASVISEQKYRDYIKDFSERGYSQAQLIWARHLLAQDENTDKAMELLLELKEKENSFALGYLSHIYEQGLHGIEKDLEKARRFKKEAIKFNTFSDGVFNKLSKAYTQAVSILNSTSNSSNTCQQKFENRT